MDKMKFYTHEEIEDKFVGKKGTLEHDKYEERLESLLV